MDRRTADARAGLDAVFCAAFFAGVVLINGVLAILFIALMQALGLWAPVAGETPPEASLRHALGRPRMPQPTRVARSKP